MDCFVPGRVILAPAEHSIEQHQTTLAEQAGVPFDIEYSIADILDRYGDLDREGRRKQFKHLPRIARIPEGEERKVAERLLRTKLVMAATPDYLVRPQLAPDLNEPLLDEAITYLAADAVDRRCGEAVKIAILDSGLEPGSLISPPTAPIQQYDVRDPADRGGIPFDPTGHGSVVAAIINRIAPGAELVPIRTFNDTGTISDVLAGLYLATMVGPCDLINLSLSVSCDVELCRVCQAPSEASTSAKQLRFFFDMYMRAAPETALIAAAGNRTSHLAMPASFAGIFAVGDFDHQAGIPSSNSNYHQVPSDRYLLGPGSRRAAGAAFASKPFHSGETYFSGTSFAAAFVTGIAARHICAMKGGPCALGPSTTGQPLYEALQAKFASAGEKSFPGYDPAKHGLGLVRYQ